MDRERIKSFEVSQEAVYESYLKVCKKDGGAGIDKETIEKLSKLPTPELVIEAKKEIENTK